MAWLGITSMKPKVDCYPLLCPHAAIGTVEPFIDPPEPTGGDATAAAAAPATPAAPGAELMSGNCTADQTCRHFTDTAAVMD